MLQCSPVAKKCAQVVMTVKCLLSVMNLDLLDRAVTWMTSSGSLKSILEHFVMALYVP